MIDERLVLALEGIIQAGGVHQRCCLIGGQALRDLYHALQAYLGPEIPAVRASQDLDLLLTMGHHVGADQALVAHLQEYWMPHPERSGTYRWRRHAEVELDLATTFGPDEQPGKVARVTLQGSRRINAYRMIPTWLHAMNLIEPCHVPALRRIGLERLRHTALLVSKVLAIEACLRELSGPAAATWVRRLDRDLDDVLFVTDRRLRSGLWCAASTLKRAEIQERLAPALALIRQTAAAPLPSLSADTVVRLETVSDGVPMWWS